MKRIALLSLVVMLTGATMASAAPRTVHVNNGDSVAVIVDGSRPQVVHTASSGLTKADRALLRENIAASKAARQAAQDAQHAVLVAQQNAREIGDTLMFWRGWSSVERFWAFVLLLALLAWWAYMMRNRITVSNTATAGDPNRPSCSYWPCQSCPYRPSTTSSPKKEESKPASGDATMTATFTVPASLIGHAGVKGEAHVSFDGSVTKSTTVEPSSAAPPAGSVTQ